MISGSHHVGQKRRNYPGVLRDDGLSYQDYYEQLTPLLFLKMAHERMQPPLNRPSVVPAGFDWLSLLAQDGIELEQHYRKLLEDLGKQPGMLGLIFGKAQNNIENPALLRRPSSNSSTRRTGPRSVRA